MRFSWDETKATRNLVKHGISFEEACSAFRDENGLRIFDPDQSTKEDRYLLLAMSGKGKLLVICHCFRKEDQEIRVITARKATKTESAQYTRRKP